MLLPYKMKLIIKGSESAKYTRVTKSKNNTDQQTSLKCETNFVLLIHMYGLLTKCEVKMAGYWPSSFFACLSK